MATAMISSSRPALSANTAAPRSVGDAEDERGGSAGAPLEAAGDVRIDMDGADNAPTELHDGGGEEEGEEEIDYGDLGLVHDGILRLSMVPSHGSTDPPAAAPHSRLSVFGVWSRVRQVQPDNVPDLKERSAIAGAGAGEDPATSSVWLEHHLKSEGWKIKYLAFTRFLSEYRWFPISGALIFLWLMSGSLFFRYCAGFTDAQAFYFTVQSGLSVGFGVEGVMANDADDPEAARWYTVGHILVGSSFIVGALGLWGSIIVNASHSHQAELEQVFRRRHLRTSQGSFGGDEMLSTSGQQYPSIFIPEDAGPSLDDEITVVGTASTPTAAKGRALLISVFLLYLSAGICFGMVHEKWVFSEALLYTVAALSTGGLVAPDSGDISMWFTGFYTLFGVPLYGYVLASAAGFLEERTRLAMKREEIAHGFNSRDRDMLHRLRVINAGDDGQDAHGIAWHQFLSIYLVKLNLACEDDIRAIRKKFDEMNVDNKNREEITIFDLNTELVFRTFDPKGWGHIDFKAFVGLCVVLISKNCIANDSLVDLTASEIRKISLADVVCKRSFLKAYVFSKARCRRLYEHFAQKMIVVRPNRSGNGAHPEHVMSRRGVLQFLRWYYARANGSKATLEDWERPCREDSSSSESVSIESF